MRSFAASLRLLVVTSFRVAPVAAIGCLAETLGVLVALLQPWFLALFVAAAAAGDSRSMALAAAGFVGQIVLSRVLLAVGMNSRMNQLTRVADHFTAEIGRITATIPTVDHLDDPRYLDQLHILREQQGAIGLAVNTLLNHLNGFVGVIGVLILATSADPRMLLVAAAGVPIVLAGPLLARWQARAEADRAEPGRLARALLALGTDPSYAGEIRVFGLGGPLRARLAAASRAWRAPMVALAARESVATAATQLLFFGVAGLIIVLLVRDTVQGNGSIADLTLALLLVNRLQSVSSTMRGMIAGLAEMSRTAARYLWLLEAADDLGHAGSRVPPAPPVRLKLREVSYRYAAADHDALDRITVELRPGQIIAVVGENGAGKSTLAEVIAGIRMPTGGAVLAGDDEIDLADVDLELWRRQITGAFQDHLRLEFRVVDTVGFGDLERRDDPSAVLQAIRAGAAEDVVRPLPAGLETQLGSSWPDGIDLSGGQWQRLAVARGMMRDQPTVRILDEPTAALDPMTEHQLFERYTAAARAGRHTGTITILVTHRFSTVAAADTIVVMEHGKITETGSHDHLMAAGGHYAELYRLQAAGYRLPGHDTA